MVAVKSGDAERFLNSGACDTAVFLFFGPDQGLVSERSAALIAKLVDDAADPFQLVRLDGDDLSSDPQRLIDEANTIPLFGGRRVIRVLLGGRAITNAVEPVLANPPKDCAIVIEAGDLKPNHAVRALVEKSRGAAAIVCYEDDVDRLSRLIDEELTPAGLRLTPDARTMLLEALGANRAASRLEIQKLVHYAQGQREITSADIDAIVGDVSRHEADSLIDAAFSADFETLEREAGPQLRHAAGAQQIVSAALRHALLLQALSSARDQSASESILGAARLFWKRRDIVASQRRLWSEAKANKAVALLSEAQLTSRRNGSVAGSIIERCLWSLALAARR